ncbi:NADH:ubiquinone reductase (Na(+)-transporting) subunit C [Aureispira]|nr:NADH:ubiquinone reductase (Na(+)-transporting) subunit C [Aureispira sp.]
MEEKKEMNVYLYVFILTSLTALILSLLYTSLNPIFEANKKEAKKKAILSCVPDTTIDLATQESVTKAYEKVTMLAVTEKGEIYTNENLDAINTMATGGVKKYKELAELDLANEEKKDASNRLYPVYKYENSDVNYYIVAIRGNGLWDKIWGYIALEDDLNTIAGVYFDHKAETPGLGAEIKDSDKFKAQFINKKVFDGSKVAFTVLKRAKKGEHYVTGISGATITSDGVTDMFASGMNYYKTYFDAVKNQ